VGWEVGVYRRMGRFGPDCGKPWTVRAADFDFLLRTLGSD
jgi:hypothetical protein